MNKNTNSINKPKQIPIKKLYLWSGNYRFLETPGDVDDQVLIKYFCEDPKYKIEELAKSIVSFIDNPPLENLLAYNKDEENYTVLEGNRRLVVYKLLANPDLAPDDNWRKRFLKLKKPIDIDDNFLLPCITAKTKEALYPYIYQKHLSPNNLVSWGDMEKAQCRVDHEIGTKDDHMKVGIKNIIMGDQDNFPKESHQILSKSHVTTFFRILIGKVSEEHFGFNLNNKGELKFTNPDFIKKLKVIITDLLEGKKNSRNLNKSEKIEEYLESITIQDQENAQTTIDSWKPKDQKKTQQPTSSAKRKETTSDQKGSGPLLDKFFPGSATKQTKIKPKQTTNERVYLIPTTFSIFINDRRIKDIFHELKKGLALKEIKKQKKIKPVTNAVSVLFRVFLEMCLDYFWEKKVSKEGFPKTTGIAGKITKVADYMAKNAIANARDLRNIRSVATNERSLLWIGNFHRYVHERDKHPSPEDLKAKWNDLENFFEILWDTLNKSN